VSAYWQRHPSPPHPPLDGNAEADVCVIGLGASGLAAVGEVRRLGHTVIGIDAAAVGAGAAGRNGGFLLAGLADFYHDAIERIGRDRAAAIYRLTLTELDRLAAHFDTADATHVGFRRTGSLRIADDDDERADCERMLAALHHDGFDAEPYDGPEGHGLLIPTDGVFDPYIRCVLASALDAPLFAGTPATAIEPNTVTTPSGTIHCGAVVVAVDGGLERTLPELAPRVRTTRLQMLATAPAPPTFTRPVYARWGYDYWQQLPTGEVLLGGCRDRFADDEWTHDAAPSAPVQTCLDTLLRDRLHITAPVTHRWAGTVGYTTTRMPVCEQVRPGVFAVGGYCGTGNVIGPLCARAAARLALQRPAAELTPLLS